MSFLQRLGERTLGLATPVRPLLASRFAPDAGPGGAPAMELDEEREAAATGGSARGEAPLVARRALGQPVPVLPASPPAAPEAAVAASPAPPAGDERLVPRAGVDVPAATAAPAPLLTWPAPDRAAPAPDVDPAPPAIGASRATDPAADPDPIRVLAPAPAFDRGATAIALAQHPAVPTADARSAARVVAPSPAPAPRAWPAPARETSRDAAPSATAAPAIEITIGRIDVRAVVTAPARHPAGPATAPRAPLSLDEYLGRIDRRGR